MRTKPQTIVIDTASNDFRFDARILWQYRELLYFLTWRDIRVRYKQSLLGVTWAILQPLLTMIIFTVVFSLFAKIPSDDLPYPVFTYSALLPWIYFSQAVTRSSQSIVGNANLISKIYFPRLIVPLSSSVAPLFDFVFAFVVLIGMMVVFGVSPEWYVVALPLFLLLSFLTALAVSLWLSALNVRYRDVTHLVPFLVQVWMYLTPVIYPVSLVPEDLRVLYGLNPMVGVIEGFRWALLGQSSPDFQLVGFSVIIVMGLLMGGYIYFKRTEETFADII